MKLDGKANSARKEINKLDKLQGCDFSNPKKVLDTKKDLIKFSKYRKTQIIKLIYILNKMSPDDVKFKKNIFKENKIDYSISNTFREKSVYFNSDIASKPSSFNIRFATLFGSSIIMSLDNLINFEYRNNKNKIIDEYLWKNSYVDSTTRNLVNLVIELVRNKDYQNNLHNFYYKSSILSSNNDVKDIDKKIDKIVKQIGILEERIIDNEFEDDILMDTVLKLSYLLATNKLSSKNIIEVKDNFSLGSSKKRYNLIEQLGEAIIKTYNKKDLNMMFKCYYNADPNLKYHRGKTEFNMGLTSLSFYDFILDSNSPIKSKLRKIMK